MNAPRNNSPPCIIEVKNEWNYKSAFSLFGSTTETVHKNEFIVKQNVNEKEHHRSQIIVLYMP